mmetsp:Transcript_28350/g.66555  ORF Transcript_28350/g.66555 Transcript_28350/m.66555 type:complete len:241 (+) Transcript_28350:1330-2052(+)
MAASSYFLASSYSSSWSRTLSISLRVWSLLVVVVSEETGGFFSVSSFRASFKRSISSSFWLNSRILGRCGEATSEEAMGADLALVLVLVLPMLAEAASGRELHTDPLAEDSSVVAAVAVSGVGGTVSAVPGTSDFLGAGVDTSRLVLEVDLVTRYSWCEGSGAKSLGPQKEGRGQNMAIVESWVSAMRSCSVVDREDRLCLCFSLSFCFCFTLRRRRRRRRICREPFLWSPHSLIGVVYA